MAEIVTGETREEYNAKKLAEKPDMKPYTVNREYDVPYGAGTSKDGKIIYIDQRLPETVDDGHGVKINLNESLPQHEYPEYIQMRRGVSYSDAHTHYANPSEKEYVERQGGNWKGYDKNVQELVRKIEHSPNPKLPPDLYLKPYGKGCKGNKDNPQLSKLHKEAERDNVG